MTGATVTVPAAEALVTGSGTSGKEGDCYSGISSWPELRVAFAKTSCPYRHFSWASGWVMYFEAEDMRGGEATSLIQWPRPRPWKVEEPGERGAEQEARSPILGPGASEVRASLGAETGRVGSIRSSVKMAVADSSAETLLLTKLILLDLRTTFPEAGVVGQLPRAAAADSR